MLPLSLCNVRRPLSSWHSCSQHTTYSTTAMQHRAPALDLESLVYRQHTGSTAEWPTHLRTTASMVRFVRWPVMFSQGSQTHESERSMAYDVHRCGKPQGAILCHRFFTLATSFDRVTRLWNNSTLTTHFTAPSTFVAAGCCHTCIRWWRHGVDGIPSSTAEHRTDKRRCVLVPGSFCYCCKSPQWIHYVYVSWLHIIPRHSSQRWNKCLKLQAPAGISHHIILISSCFLVSLRLRCARHLTDQFPTRCSSIMENWWRRKITEIMEQPLNSAPVTARYKWDYTFRMNQYDCIAYSLLKFDTCTKAPHVAHRWMGFAPSHLSTEF